MKGEISKSSKGLHTVHNLVTSEPLNLKSIHREKKQRLKPKPDVIGHKNSI